MTQCSGSMVIEMILMSESEKVGEGGMMSCKRYVVDLRVSYLV